MRTIQHTRELILAAAAELFAERGYDSTPLTEIARKAQVVPGTIIYHFKRKEHILGQLAIRYLLGLHDFCRDRALQNPAPLARVLAYVAAYHEYHQKHHREGMAYFKNLPGERFKSDGELGPKIAAAERGSAVLLQSLLQLDADNGDIPAHLVSCYTRSIQALLLGGVFMVFFQKGDARAIADEAAQCVKSLIPRATTTG